jgi:hypothetical protein
VGKVNGKEVNFDINQARSIHPVLGGHVRIGVLAEVIG